MNNINIKEKEILYQLSKILIPEEYLKDFEVTSIKELPQEWVIEMREKEENIPVELQRKDVVMDGYCNPVDVLTHAISLKRIYLRLYRRRWKERGNKKHYSNSYDTHIPGMKTTKSFGVFLKANNRKSSGKFCNDRRNFKDTIKDNILLV